MPVIDVFSALIIVCQARVGQNLLNAKALVHPPLFSRLWISPYSAQATQKVNNSKRSLCISYQEDFFFPGCLSKECLNIDQNNRGNSSSAAKRNSFSMPTYHNRANSREQTSADNRSNKMLVMAPCVGISNIINKTDVLEEIEELLPKRINCFQSLCREKIPPTVLITRLPLFSFFPAFKSTDHSKMITEITS